MPPGHPVDPEAEGPGVSRGTEVFGVAMPWLPLGWKAVTGRRHFGFCFEKEKIKENI